MHQKNKNISIAVLPFQVASIDERIKTLFVGFTEDLITNFSKFIGLSVISSFSTQRISDTTNQSEIEKLGADYLIFGSVRHLNESLRISIQLIKSEDFSLVFAGQHDETLDNILEAQDSIVLQIVSVLQEKINYNLLSHSYKKNSVELAAYENYLLGMNTLYKGTADNDINAIASMGMIPQGYRVNNFLTDTDAFYIITDVPNGMKYFERTPIRTAMEGDFDTGNVRYKARERYRFGVSDYRGIFGVEGA